MTTNTQPLKGNRTNTKEVKSAIQKYIVDTIDTENFDGHDGTFKTSLQIVCDEFKNAAVFENNIKRLKTWQAVYCDWLLGMPSSFNVTSYNSEILDLMASFGLPLPANKDEQDGIDLFYYLIYREFLTICKNNKVDFYSYLHY